MAIHGAELHTAATRWLNDHWPDPRLCLICRADSWSMGHRLVEVREFVDEVAQDEIEDVTEPRDEFVQPYLVVECLTCGHAVFFNTGVMRIHDGTGARSRVFQHPA